MTKKKKKKKKRGEELGVKVKEKKKKKKIERNSKIKREREKQRENLEVSNNEMKDCLSWNIPRSDYDVSSIRKVVSILHFAPYCMIRCSERREP